jgi:hypothetical protein
MCADVNQALAKMENMDRFPLRVEYKPFKIPGRYLERLELKQLRKRLRAVADESCPAKRRRMADDSVVKKSWAQQLWGPHGFDPIANGCFLSGPCQW